MSTSFMLIYCDGFNVSVLELVFASGDNALPINAMINTQTQITVRVELFFYLYPNLRVQSHIYSFSPILYS